MITVVTKEQHVKSILQLSTKKNDQIPNNIPPSPPPPPEELTPTSSTTTTIATITNEPAAKITWTRQNSLYHVFLTSILHLLHFIYITYIAFKTLKSYIYTHFINTSATGIHQRIQYDKSKLTKIPNHLAINISRELSSTRTLEQWDEIMYSVSFATCWAWEFGIKEVSVYDQSGVMKSMEVDLYKQQSNMLHEWIQNNSFGEKSQPVIKFSILSGENGQSQIGHVTQQLALSNNNKEIDIKLVDEYMRKNTISDPDLMIVYDGLPHSYISLDGYPSWQLRLTEIVNCSNYHQLNYNLFSKCLYRFSRVEQRFGR